MDYLKAFYCGVLYLCSSHLLEAQEIGSGNKKSAFTLNGGFGASANFYTSNETVATRPSFAWNTYGSFMARTKEVELPFSFVINQYNNSHTSPYIQAGISPTYQWAKLHLGYRNMLFSPFTFEGQSFRGAGLELTPSQFRFAAFYGRLNKAVNEDTSSSSFRLPQYSRTGYGVKVGVGNSNRFFDLIYFHAKDDSSSASIINRSSRNALHAQENAVMGTSFKLTIAKKWIWTGDAAISGLVQDLSGKQSFDSSNETSRKFIKNFLPNNANVLANYAGQSSLTFVTTNFNGNLGYRRVQPGFKSFGTPYMTDDIELISFLSGFSIVNGKVNISTNLSQQHNNLNETLEAEMQTQVGNLNVNAILGQNFNLNLNFSGYNLKQRNDRNELPDSLRLPDSILLRQRIAQYSLNPSYNITNGNNIHYISGNITLQTLKDKNPKTAPQTNSNNLSSSLTYTLALIKQAYSFSFNYLYSRYKQEVNSYNSNGATVGASAQLLKDKTLNMQGSFGLIFNRFNKNIRQRNMTYSASAGYRAKRHYFSLFANYIYTPPNNAINDAINKTVPYAVASKNLNGGVSYNYNF